MHTLRNALYKQLHVFNVIALLWDSLIVLHVLSELS